MRGPGHVDRRRSLLPRDYLVRPDDFGRVPGVLTSAPPGGNDVSRRIALLQSDLVFGWNARGRRPTAASLCRRFGVSKQTLSRVTLGERWAGETVLAALVVANID